MFDGDPSLHDSELAALSAFLLMSNEASRAVEQGETFYEVVMWPVETAGIDVEIERLHGERQELEANS